MFLLTRFIRKKNLEKCCCKITEIKNGNKSKNSSNRDPETIKNVKMVVVFVLCLYLYLDSTRAKDSRVKIVTRTISVIHHAYREMERKENKQTH